MYSTRMHPHYPQEDYNTLWWITPACFILGLLVAVSLSVDQGQVGSFAVIGPPAATEPTVLHDSAMELINLDTLPAPSYGVPDASAVVGRSPEIEESHAPTF